METLLKRRTTFILGERTSRIITEIIISLFILLFMYTASSKIFGFKDFDKVLSEVPMFGSFHQIIAVTIPALEIIIGSLLIIPPTKKIGLYASLGLIIIFTIYLSYMVAVSSRLPCSCGGVISNMTWQHHIWFNIGLICLASFGILTNLNKNKS